MTPYRSFATLLTSALLGLQAVAALVTGAFMFFGAWAISTELSGDPFDIGVGATILVGILLVAYAGLSALAARATWLSYPSGPVLGLIVGLVTTLAAVTALLVGETADAAPMLVIAIIVGIVTVLGVLAATAPLADRGHGTA
jgi:hypothetical protein